MGDLNDFDGVTLDSNNDKPTSQVLEILKGNAGDHKGKYVMETSAELIDKTERYTDWWDPNNVHDRSCLNDAEFVRQNKKSVHAASLFGILRHL